MEFRIVDEQDKDEVKWLWGYCFEDYEPFYSWYFSHYYKTENTLGGYKKGKLVSSLQLIPYQIYLRGKILETSYIVGLATYPEARRKNSVNFLLQAALREMKQRGHCLSLLMPFKAGFYYPYQWELCYHHYKYLVPLQDLRGVADDFGNFILVRDKEDIAALEEVYKKFVQDKHGYTVRTEVTWQHILEEHWGGKGFIYLLEKDGQPEGYIMYFLRDKKIIVREMAYSGFLAQKALFQFLYNHRSQAKMLEWNAPLDDLTYCLLPDPQKEIRIIPFMAGRIVDVCQLLTSIEYPKNIRKKLNLRVKDPLAPWNNGVFSLQVEGGSGKVKILEEKNKSDINCSIGALSQLVFGRLKAKDLTLMNNLGVEKEGALDTLERIFPQCNNYINEYF